jgi:hypothetical protein
MSSLFNENMSFIQALKTVFRESEGKSEEEQQGIHDEYAAVIPAINRREMELAEQGWMC